MKTIVLSSVLCIFFGFALQAQNSSDLPSSATDEVSAKTDTCMCEEDVYVIVSKMPQYKEGEKALKDYFFVDSSGVNGNVYVSFVIDCCGRVSEPQVVRGLEEKADQKALELVQNMPNWNPGVNGHKKVKVRCVYPIRFI